MRIQGKKDMLIFCFVDCIIFIICRSFRSQKVWVENSTDRVGARPCHTSLINQNTYISCQLKKVRISNDSSSPPQNIR